MINHLFLATSTLVGEPIDININLLLPAIQYANNNGKQAIELNRLKDKTAKYRLHKIFLAKYIEKNVMPKDSIFE